MKKFVGLILVIMLIVMSVLGCSSQNSSVEDYPNKSIDFIVPYSAGGGTDTLMRLLTATMEEELGQSVVITNLAGNLGQVGLTELSRRDADGYSIGALSNLDHILVLLTGENVEYTYDDFEYIGAINTTANVIIASEQSGIQTLDDMIAFAKDNPGGLTVSISGKTHLAEVALFEKAADIEVTTVMQNSGGDSLNALLGGHTDLAVMDKNFVAQVEGHNCPTLAIFSGERVSVVPDVPTLKELGYEVDTETYRVITAPKGTPQEILEILSDTMEKVTNTDEFKNKMGDLSEIYRFLDSKEVKAKLDNDYKNMEDLIKEVPDAF